MICKPIPGTLAFAPAKPIVVNLTLNGSTSLILTPLVIGIMSAIGWFTSLTTLAFCRVSSMITAKAMVMKLFRYLLRLQ